jgi:transposase InsO family protein
MAYSIENKYSETIAKYLKIAFSKFFKKPQIIHSDNGTEFKNKIVKDTLTFYKIKQVFGKPRKPRSQGAVENFNGIISKYVFREFDNYLMTNISNKKTKGNVYFDLQNVLEIICNNLNTIKCSVTGEIPQKALFYEEDRDSEKIKKMKEHIDHYYNRKYNQDIELVQGTKALIVKNVLPSNNFKTLEEDKNPFKKQFLKNLVIPVQIID